MLSDIYLICTVMFRNNRDPLSEARKERLAHEMRQKAERIIAVDQIQMDDFRDLYSDQVVDADSAEVARLAARFSAEQTPEEKRSKELATVLEAIILEQMDQSMWFGERVTTVAAAPYDDYVNGVDMIATVDVSGQARAHTGLAIDVTFSGNAKKKFDRILRNISNGTAASVKYFDNGDVRGELKQIPRVVLGVQGANAQHLGELWVSQKHALEQHPIILQFADQIFQQLEAYTFFAERVHGTNHPMTDMLRRQYHLWSEVFSDIDEAPLASHAEADRFGMGDAVHAQIMQIADQIRRGAYTI